MTRIAVEKVTLRFPIFSKAQAHEHTDDIDHDSRLIVSKAGRITSVQALTDIDFALSQGDRLALLGQNGSGKTTLLQVISGLLPPDEGRVLVRGKATNLININLGGNLAASGHRNITLRGLAGGYSRQEIEEKRPSIVDFCGLGEFLDMPVMTYSAGMRMRLFFAIATAFEPEILILDEWLSTGDAGFKAKAAERMNSFVDRAGILVLASHSRELLQANCNLALWLDRGRCRAFGEINQVLDAYDAAYVSASQQAAHQAAE
ncbi:MAG: ATP-binding cassette domain-containing protein [Pseudomonadota bacterium]